MKTPLPNPKNSALLIVLFLWSTLTIGQSNDYSVEFSVRGGYFQNPVQLELSSEGGTIYYTTDGSEPDRFDNRYSSPITIEANTVIRAASFESNTESAIVTHSYFFDVVHTFPIVSFAFDEDSFFGPEGIYTLYEQDIETLVNIELFEPDGTQGFTQVVAAEIGGSSSAQNRIKSLVVKARSEYGKKNFDYQVFKNSPLTDYKSLYIRNSGQDNLYTNFRDAFVSELIRKTDDLGVFMDEPAIDIQNYRPAVVYFNGEYFGILNIRERMDWRYVKVHYGLEKEEIDRVEEDGEVKDGDDVAWRAFRDFLENNRIQSEEVFNELAQQLDIDNTTDYYAFNVFVDNCDWPDNNNRKWRPRTPTGKWRHMMKDLDFTFGLYGFDGSWNDGIYTQNSLQRLFNDSGTQHPNSLYSTLLFRRMVEWEPWRHAFINRTADFMNTIFEPNRVNQILDGFVEAYAEENKRSEEKWLGGWSHVPKTVAGMKRFADNRIPVMHQHFIQQFGEITSVERLEVNVQGQVGGNVKVNSLLVNAAQAPWDGVYFAGVPVQLQAIPEPGYRFVGWLPENLPQEKAIRVDVSNVRNVTAVFEPTGGQAIDIVINELNYNSPSSPNSGDWVELYNKGSVGIDLSNWTLAFDSTDEYVIPSGTVLGAGEYLVLVESTEEFDAVYSIDNRIGDLGYKLSNGGGLLELFTASKSLVDRVDYDDKEPWPEAADGDGPTLQLRDVELDNTEPESWAASTATPGATNVIEEIEEPEEPIASDIVINELNYNSPDEPNSGDWVELYNKGTDAIDLSGWILVFDDEDQYTIPSGTVLGGGEYLVLVESTEEFDAVYTIDNRIGNLGYKLSNGGGLLELFNAEVDLVDRVDYDDKEPWPEAADGDGPTLQLRASDLDNNAAESWTANDATPGTENGADIDNPDPERLMVCDNTIEMIVNQNIVQVLPTEEVAIMKLFDKSLGYEEELLCNNYLNQPCQSTFFLTTGSFDLMIQNFDGAICVIPLDDLESLESNNFVRRPQYSYDVKWGTTKVFPNPTEGLFSVYSSAEIIDIQMYSMSGQLVRRFSTGSQDLDIEDIAKGMYMLHIRTDERMYFERLLKL